MLGPTLIMPFTNDEHSFTLGFEGGMIWGRLSSGECFDNHLFHNENIDQVKLICEAHGADYTITGFCDGWSYLTIHQTIIQE